MGERPDQEEFLALVDGHQRILGKICHLWADGPTARDDLRQEILLQLWRSYPSFRGASSAATWIYRVALNTALLGRRRRRPPAAPLPEELPAPAAPGAERDLELAALRACIRALPEVDRVLVLLHLEGESYERIAEVTGLGKSNVSVRLVRIRKRLHACLAARGWSRG